MLRTCKFCPAFTVNGPPIYQFGPADDRAYYDHIEDHHHIAVVREGEDYGSAALRFLASHPTVYPNGDCTCPNCLRRKQVVWINQQIPVAEQF